MDFDFEKMMLLAKDNPKEFEYRRNILLDEVIQRNPNVKWAKAFQSRIDMERRKAKTPLACCLRLYSLMWDSFHKLDKQLQAFLYTRSCLHELGLSSENKNHQLGGAKPRVTAKILQFRKR